MKLTAKFTLAITTFSVLFLVVFGVLFYSQTSGRLEAEFVRFAQNHMTVLSTQIRQLLLDEINSAKIMANNPIIDGALSESNETYSRYDPAERKKIIEESNTRWMEADESDPFVRDYLENPVADYLARQQELLPENYGEIFLTNRYGTVVASTSKLTTFYHENKYWWQGAFFDGKGTVFVDDRGFDTSVGGYVLGIVVPVRMNNRIIGILKCNINIMSFLQGLLSYNKAIGSEFKLQLVRSNGRVVLAEDVQPLSTRVSDELLPLLQKDFDAGGARLFETSRELFIISPISSSVRDNVFRFGGSPKSVDHLEGNEGEHWDFIAIASKEAVYKESRHLLFTMLYVGLVFIFGMLVIAYFISRGLTRKVRTYVPLVKMIGAGNLSTRLPEGSRDELGTLAKAFNSMLSELQKTLTTKDRLEKLIIEKDFLMKELNHRVKNNLLMINSLINLKNAALGGEVDLSDLIHQIDAIRIVHEKLYQTEEVSHIDMEGYINELLTTVFSLSGKSVTTDTDITDVTLPIKKAIPLGLIINEIATNAVKHGFTGNEEYKFSVELIADTADDTYLLTLSNNGQPFPEGVDLDNPGTLGLRLISAMVEQLGGDIELQRGPHPIFRITMNCDRER